ncbi:MAG: response regulator [Magnetococcales bacterium]|nr:response regulator [Magnetococcales bacterium]
MSDEKRKASILIVDDTPENLDVLKGTLIDDYMVRPAINGPLALRLAVMEPKPDLILLDIMMPEMDGFEVCRKLKQNIDTQDIPVIFVTAKSSDQDELEGLEMGAVDYITKPISPAIVKTRVKTQLALRNFNQEMEENNRRLYEINEKLTDSMEQLAASEDRFRSLVQTIPDIVYKIDAEGRFTFLNKSVERLGYHQSDLIGKHFSELIHSADVNNASLEKVVEKIGKGTKNPDQKVFDERRSGLRMTVGLEIRLKTKSGKKAEVVEIRNINQQSVNVEVNSTGLYGDVGNDTSYRTRQYVGTVGVIRDITDRQKIQKALEQAKQKAEVASKAKGDFLANMSHEIRTPLNAVIGLAHLCLQTDLSNQQHDYLDKIKLSGNSLLQLINDILDFSKIEAGKLSMESSEFSLDEVLGGVGAILSIKSQEKGVELLFDTANDVPTNLGGDSLRLGQILTNLVGNAIKFTEKGEIVVSNKLLEESFDSVKLHFSVKDSGIGMTTEEMATLFQEFSQADIATTRKYGGTGLGLTISKRLVEMMGGEISVTSEPDKGSCFTFTARFDKVEGQGGIAVVPAEDIRKLHILVVDDNDSARKITTVILNSLNYDPVCVKNGEEAVEMVVKADKDGSPFDLLFMDWRMPGIDGLETTRQIKTELTIGKVPKIIMISAFNRDDVVPADNKLDLLDGFVVKPTNRTAILEATMAAFGHAVATPFSRGDESHLIKSLPGVKVLLVEDNEINQQVAQELLEQAHIRVVTANNGQEAVELATTDSFDCILMDIQMPIMDGFKATQKIREGIDSKDLPIIAMTANTMSGDREKCLDSGMNDHIGKPVVPHELYTTLAKWVQNRSDDSQPHSEDATPEKDKQPLLPIPPLYGVNVTVGLRNVGGNSKLYRKILKGFALNQGQSCRIMQEFFNVGNLEALEHEAHALKGVAATIGADKLSSYAEKLEKIARNQEDLEAFPVLLEETSSELILVVSNIETSLVTDEPKPTQNNRNLQNVEPDILKPLFKKAMDRLRNYDSSVDDVVEEIMPLVSSKKRLEMLNSIQEALESYDFERGLSIFEEWAKKEGIDF